MNRKLVKHVIFRLHEKIVGRKTYAFLAELTRLQWESPARLADLKFEKLKALLLHAKKNIPFYGERFAEAGFKPETLQSVEDIRVLPLLTKSVIRENLDRMQWKDCPGGLHQYNTGGSSGEPLIFYFDRRRQACDAASRALYHLWWGCDIGDKELYFWGSPVEETRQDRIKSFRDRITNELLISAFDVSEAVVPEYAEVFRKFRPKCLYAYPSTLSLFCEMAKRQNVRLDEVGVRAVFCTAEVLYDHQREVISEFFGGIPVVDSYGCREGGNVNAECEKGIHHIFDPYYVVEFLENGEPAPDGGKGETVLTHLDAWAMPFIRYNTGDMAGPGPETCDCGRGFSTMTRTEGRSTDFIVTPDGRYQHGLGVIYVVREIEGVKTFKIVQEDVDHVRVLLTVDDAAFPADGDARIVDGFHKRLGDDVRIEVERMDEIPRDKSGKYRYVVSKVAHDGFPGDRAIGISAS